jgi:hypothetical protein
VHTGTNRANAESIAARIRDKGAAAHVVDIVVARDRPMVLTSMPKTLADCILN